MTDLNTLILVILGVAGCSTGLGLWGTRRFVRAFFHDFAEQDLALLAQMSAQWGELKTRQSRAWRTPIEPTHRAPASEDAAAPYEFMVRADVAQNGAHAYSAQAITTPGAAGISAPVAVTVQIVAHSTVEPLTNGKFSPDQDPGGTCGDSQVRGAGREGARATGRTGAVEAGG